MLEYVTSVVFRESQCFGFVFKDLELSMKDSNDLGRIEIETIKF